MSNKDYFIVNGGKKLKGEIHPSGNKNEALPVIAATLLTNEEVILSNIPNIIDTNIMIDIAKDLGVIVKKIKANTFSFTAKKINKDHLNENMASRIRSSLLYMAPVIIRKGSITLPSTGGDKIGQRRIDSHLIAFQKLGVKIKEEKAGCKLIGKKLSGTDFTFDEASVMATENAVMLATLTPGKTSIYNCACEPHVQGLCNLLVAMGAKIKGVGTNMLTINGVKKLHGAKHKIMPDHIEVGSFIGLAATIGNGITIKNAYTKHMDIIFPAFAKIGLKVEVKKKDIFIPGGQKLKVHDDFGGKIPSISDQPWPSFPADLTSIMVVASLYSKGTIMIHEKMFEGRLFFVDSLIRMGAKLVLCDPHRVVITGPTKLHGVELSSPDIRAGMTMLIAALSAKGKSIIHNIKQIDRGYEGVEHKLNGLGAKIERVTE